MATPFETHDVVNQAPPLAGYDGFGSDAALVEGVEREGAGWARAELHELGVRAGSFEALELGRRANENPPVLLTHDRYGNRIDVVHYHPAYHELMTTAVGHGLHAAPWADDREGAHVARAAKVIVWYQVDGGHVCPISMTYSVIPALRARARSRGGVGAAAHDACVRPVEPARRRQDRRDVRHGDDREAGRLRRARQHDGRGTDGRRVPADRPQVVLLGADVGRVPDARAGAAAGCRASSCPGGGPTAAGTRSTSNG